MLAPELAVYLAHAGVGREALAAPRACNAFEPDDVMPWPSVDGFW